MNPRNVINNVMLPYEKQKPKTPQPYGLMSTVADLKIGMLNA